MIRDVAIAILVCSGIGVFYFIINKCICPTENDNSSHSYRLNSEYISNSNVQRDDSNV